MLKKTKTGPSTDAEVLEQLAEMGHELPKLILGYRELQKLKNTYVDVLPLKVNRETGRIHTSFNQVGAQTGRLSSTDPNLQNIPVRTSARRGHSARLHPGDGLPLRGGRLLADRAAPDGAPLRRSGVHRGVSKGGDIHRQTASIIFGVPLDRGDR